VEFRAENALVGAWEGRGVDDRGRGVAAAVRTGLVERLLAAVERSAAGAHARGAQGVRVASRVVSPVVPICLARRRVLQLCHQGLLAAGRRPAVRVEHAHRPGPRRTAHGAHTPRRRRRCRTRRHHGDAGCSTAMPFCRSSTTMTLSARSGPSATPSTTRGGGGRRDGCSDRRFAAPRRQAVQRRRPSPSPICHQPLPTRPQNRQTKFSFPVHPL